MLKKSAAVVLASLLMFSAIPGTAAEESETVNNSVSGYVSTSKNDGFVLVDKNKTPVIHIDADDYESVIRAAGDLSTDIKSVTGITPEVNSDDITAQSGEAAAGISIDGEAMSVSLNSPVQDDAQCFVAVYDRNKALAGVEKATDKKLSADNYVTGFSFEKALTMPDGGEIKAFVWSQNMEPLTDVLGMAADKNVNLDSVDVVIGTLGMSETIDALAIGGELNISEIENKWESFTIQNINNTLVIAGSDKRGTIYGIYDLCEKIGVSPWKWWSDVDPTHADELYINLPEDGYTEGEPSVKYRGIFINDEYNLNQWSTALGNGKAMTHETYEKVFELLLRLKANYLWPAMHEYSPAFHNDEENAKLADKYGIVMGSSHCEPLLRNNLGELDAFQDKWEAANPDKPLYKAIKNESGKSVAYYWTDHDNSGKAVYNREFLEDYWRESVNKYGIYENVYSLGMRGVHDGSFQTNMDYVTALNEIITCQRKIIQEEICVKTGKDITEIPQVFIPYKDILKYYNAGQLKIPEDVTIMWTDDNYGYVRQNADDTERANSGRTGIYYHVSYYGWPTSYLWLTTTQPGLIREEMGKSYDMGADKMWILNVGDLKPAENDIEYFLKLARDINIRNENIDDIFAAKAKRDFNLGDVDARKYAEIMDEYYELANSKRPEFIRSGEISVTAYGDEGKRYLDRCKDLTVKAEQMYASLTEDKKDSFYELVLYPIRSFTNMMTDYIQTDRANLYAEQGRGTAPYQYANEVAKAAEQIDTDTLTFNSLRNGKWNKIMNINPSKLQSCDAHITTDLSVNTPSSLDYTSLEIAVDSQTSIDEEKVINLSVYDTYNKFIDVINQGYGSLDYTVTSDAEYIDFSKTSGTVNGSDRVYVSLDKSAQIPVGTSSAVITVSQKFGDWTVATKDITVNISNPDVTLGEKTYVEAGGTISIEAENYSNAVSNGDYEWKIEKDFGRSGDSVKAYPDLAVNVETPNTTNSAYLEYDIYFENSGTYTLDIYRMPTLNERNNMIFAVGIDDNDPTLLKGTSTYSGEDNKADAWARGVLDNSQKLRTTVNVPESGSHTLRLYNVSPGVVIDKMVLTRGTEVTESYFGAPESYNTTYNTAIEEIPSYNDEASTASIKKIYDPDLLVGTIDKSASQINSINLIKLTDKYENAVVAITGYDAQGNMTTVNFAKVDLSGTAVNGQLNVPISVTLPSQTNAYAVTVFDSFTNMHLLAPYKEYGMVVTEAESDSIAIKTDLSDYIGKKSVTLIADCEITEEITADNIKYIHGEDVAANSYKYIPFENNAKGVYYMRTGIYGEKAINEVKNTIVNIYPDNNGVEKINNTWSFDETLNDDSGVNPFVTTGGASLTDGKIKLNNASTGSATMTYSNPISIMSGEKVTAEFDIYVGKLSGKNTSYSITDKNGNVIAGVKLGIYDGNFSAEIGGNSIDTDTSAFNELFSGSNSLALANDPAHFKNEIDFTARRVTITVSRSGREDIVLKGKIGDNISSDISSIEFKTNYANNDRACYVDNVNLKVVTAPQYAITVNAINASDKSDISSAQITVTDAITKAEILPNSDGVYMLCEGDYIISASADGFRAAEQMLELIPALESTTVNIEMTSDAELTPATVTIKYVDELGDSLKDDDIITDDVYVGDIYTVPDSYTVDFTSKNDDGKTNLYKFNASDSQTTVNLTANTEIILVFNLAGQYEFYEDFENYGIDQSAWQGTASALSVAEDSNSKYLKYASNGGTIGACTEIDPIDCEGKTVRIEADLKFAPKGTAGNSQFTIGDTAPTFSDNNYDWGIVSNSSGHIIAFEYNTGSTFKVNGTTVSSNLIDSWLHMTADVDFTNKKVNIKITNSDGISEELTDLNFYSSNAITEIGSMYIRAAKANGTVSVDNIKISMTDENAQQIIGG